MLNSALGEHKTQMPAVITVAFLDILKNVYECFDYAYVSVLSVLPVQRPEEGVESPGTGAKSTCELPHMGASNQTQLYKSSKCS